MLGEMRCLTVAGGAFKIFLRPFFEGASPHVPSPARWGHLLWQLGVVAL